MQPGPSEPSRRHEVKTRVLDLDGSRSPGGGPGDGWSLCPPDPGLREGVSPGQAWWPAVATGGLGDNDGSDQGRRLASRQRRYVRRWHVRRITQVKRFAFCGRLLNGSAEGKVIVRKTEDGTCHYSGLQSCGSVWSCPVCASKIRQHRADELESGIARWLAQGGGIEFVTLTTPHELDDGLAVTLDRVMAGWRQGIVAGGQWMADRKAWGVEAWCRVVEVTHGAHGWHPHIHALLFTSKPWTPRQRAMRGRALFHRWARWVEQAGGGRCDLRAFSISGGGKGAGAYLAKLQDGEATGLGMEMTRSDLKRARGGSVTPMQMIEAAANGEAWALDAWWEWEDVTRGRRCMTWSKCGRGLVCGDVEPELSDQEVVEQEVGGDVVGAIDGEAWAIVVRVPGREAALLTWCEQGRPVEAFPVRAGP